ncbi:MAG: hypothetical protein HY286_09265 [Planctomycetes bacterium]|nr:hypothetical protein [Planctomycetota bacterium]
MGNNEDVLKTTNIQKIVDEGSKIYDQIKVQYDPKEKGKFLAIEVESQKAYLGTTSAEALAAARDAHPNKVFYVVKIGYDVAETMARALVEKR